MSRRVTQAALAAVTLLAAVAAAGLVAILPRAEDARMPIARAAAARAPLLVDSLQGTGPLRLRPVDPATLADVAGLAPVELGHHYTHALSADGRTLAVVVWPSGSTNRGGSLQLIDLATWTVRVTSVTIDEDVLGPAYGSDGASLWWAQPTWRDRAHSMPRAYALMRYDIAAGQVVTVLTLADSFAPWQLRPMRDGHHVALFGVPTDASNLTEDAPRVQVIDAGARALAADLPLGGLKAGQYHVSDGQHYPWQLYWPGLAWDLARDRLYVVYPDDERISMVDLAAGRVSEDKPLQPRATLLDDVFGVLAARVEAKSGPTTQRSAVLSPDGSRLYVNGQRDEETLVAANQYHSSVTQEGLRIVDTRDLAEIRRLDAPGSVFMLAPNQPRILLDTLHATFHATDQHGVLMLDANSLGAVGAFDVEDGFYPRGFSPDGRYAYIEKPIGPSRIASTLRVVDIGDGHVVSERVVDGYVADLLLNPSFGPDL